MCLIFKNVTPEHREEIEKYHALRPSFISESQFLNQYLWADFYQTKYALTEYGLFYLIQVSDRSAAFMPRCKESDCIPAFFEIADYFENVLEEPLRMYCVDSFFIKELCTSNVFQQKFQFTKNRDTFDYIYDASRLKTLSGRAYHKKKNHLNSFLRHYNGHFEYRTLDQTNIDEIKTFHEIWEENRPVMEREDSMAGERDGLYRLLDHLDEIPCKIAGVYMDDELEAYTIGSYSDTLKCAFIHVEKANLKYNGLYNYINQQFLLHEFPEAVYVNREDDLGQEGLRKSKLSYQPIRLEEKYVITAKK